MQGMNFGLYDKGEEMILFYEELKGLKGLKGLKKLSDG